MNVFGHCANREHFARARNSLKIQAVELLENEIGVFRLKWLNL